MVAFLCVIPALGEPCPMLVLLTLICGNLDPVIPDFSGQKFLRGQNMSDAQSGESH